MENEIIRYITSSVDVKNLIDYTEQLDSIILQLQLVSGQLNTINNMLSYIFSIVVCILLVFPVRFTYKFFSEIWR